MRVPILAPWSGWPLLTPQGSFAADACLGEDRNRMGKWRKWCTPNSCHTGPSFQFQVVSAEQWLFSVCPKTSQRALGTQTISCGAWHSTLLILKTSFSLLYNQLLLQQGHVKGFGYEVLLDPSDSSHPVCTFLFVIEEFSHRQGREIPWLKYFGLVFGSKLFWKRLYSHSKKKV